MMFETNSFDRNIVHLELWDVVLNRVAELIKTDEYDISYLDKATSIITKAQKGQRIALGLDDISREVDKRVLEEIVRDMNESRRYYSGDDKI